MTTRIHAAFWENEDCVFNAGDKDATKIGKPGSKLGSKFAEADQPSSDNLLEKHGITEQEVNARQGFHKLKQCKGESSMALPMKCVLQAPEQINVYTDGSWLFPLKQFLGLGGAGIWWPGRTIHRDDVGKYIPLSTAEEEMTLLHQNHEGLRLFTKIGGFSGSSIASLSNSFGSGRRDEESRNVLKDPYGLNPQGERDGPDGPDQTRSRFSHDAERWTTPFVMAPINTRVVRRTNALLGYIYGRDFCYSEAMITGKGIKGRCLAAMLSLGQRLLKWAFTHH